MKVGNRVCITSAPYGYPSSIINGRGTVIWTDGHDGPGELCEIRLDNGDLVVFCETDINMRKLTPLEELAEAAE
jgi:hypothetical protein